MSESPHDDFDLIVIGAGINGAGVARDAAMRGLKVCVLDKGDVGGGTSSWSTRLIHGGLRYLEHWEFALVRESLRERETLLKIAPHLVKSIPILIPIYKSARRGELQIRAGMLLYDLLSYDKTLPRYRMLSRDETVTRAPALKQVGLTSAAVYYDAQVEFAERLVLENVLDAQAHGAQVLTYAQVTRISTENGKATGVEFSTNSQSKTVRSSFVINAAGPWVDELLKTSGNTNRLVGGTRGSHIIVAPFNGALPLALYAEAQTDGRPFFIIPWNGNYLIGTTDIYFSGDPGQVRCTEEEIKYLLAEANHILSTIELKRSDILFSYSGVRPLAFTANQDEKSITRRHFIREHHELSNVCSLVGGKLTTYRRLAEECVDLVFKKLRKRAERCTTAEDPLPGAKAFKSFCSESANDLVAPAIIERLLRIYGSRTSELFEICAREVRLFQPLNASSQVLSGEVVFAFEREMAQTLVDCLLRRTMCGLNGDLAIGEDEAAAKIACKFLGWSEERAQQEVNNHRLYIKRMEVNPKAAADFRR
jgi:glycerol-3-phosphate dehydrogenase